MLSKIKSLLQDPEVQQAIKKAKTQDEVINVLKNASAKKGENLQAEQINAALTGLALEQVSKLSEKELNMDCAMGFSINTEPQRCI